MRLLPNRLCTFITFAPLYRTLSLYPLFYIHLHFVVDLFQYTILSIKLLYVRFVAALKLSCRLPLLSHQNICRNAESYHPPEHRGGHYHRIIGNA